MFIVRTRRRAIPAQAHGSHRKWQEIRYIILPLTIPEDMSTSEALLR